MKVKKIMFVLPRLHTNLIPLIKLLEQNKIKVSVLAFYTYKGVHSEYHENVNLNIVGFSKPINFFLPKSQKHRLGIPSVKCYKKIIQNKPDLIIVRDFLPSSSFIHFFCKILGLPTVMYTQKPFYGWKPSLLRRLYQTIFFPKNVFTTSIGNINNKTVSINHYLLGRKWRYVPFTAEVCSKARNRKYFYNDKINILLVSKFSRRKMILEFLHVFNTLYKEHKDIQLTIVGTILEEHILEKAETFISEHNLPVSIKISIPYNKMAKLYLINDVFVLPSIREPASISQLEAMCHGLAVVCSDDNGTAYYIKPRINGEVFDASNFFVDLESKMKWILESRDRIRTLGQASIKIVEENHNVNNFLSYISAVKTS